MPTEQSWGLSDSVGEERIEEYRLLLIRTREELELPANSDIKEELADPEFAKYTHGTRSTYSLLGCRGPLCRKAERDRGRRKHEIKMLAKGKSVNPPPPGEARDRDDFLNWILAWHRSVRKSNPENKTKHNMRSGFDPLYTREADQRALREAERVTNHQQTA